MAVLNDIRQRLSYALGESTQPSSTSEIAMRDQFINDSQLDIYNRREWSFAQSNATVTLVNGLASLPSSVRQEGLKDIRIVNTGGIGDDWVFTEVPYQEFDLYSSDKYAYYLSGSAEAGGYTAQLTVTNASIASIRYVQKPPLLANVSDTIYITNGADILAKGALVRYRQQEDPQADVTPETQAFEAEILKLVQLEHRGKPITRAKGIAEVSGYGGAGRRRNTITTNAVKV